MKACQTGVIVSTSGMLNGGPAVQWAQSILPEENDALLLCGYQDEYAPGRKLENLTTQGGPRELELPDLEEGTVLVPVRARVQRYRLSAHADKRGLLDIITEVNPANVMLVHGEPKHQQPFRQDLRKADFSPVPTQAWTL
jgi:predicted metal-dependent RNase